MSQTRKIGPISVRNLFVKKILLCDSDVAMLTVMKTHLSWYGFATTAVDNSARVREFLQEASYDLFICDHLSQPINASVLCEEIRQSPLPRIRGIPIFMLACGQVEVEAYKFLRQRNIYFMSKFQSPEKWFEKINAIIKGDVTGGLPTTV